MSDSTINWNSTKADRQLIGQIVDRAERMKLTKPGTARTSLTMDIEACHLNGNPLKLQELLEAKSFDFLHDVGGIRRNINRRTGELDNHFSPRYSA